MRSFRIEGIIIKRRNIGETDRVIALFTKKLGKIQVKAIGVRKISSRRSPHIELINHSVLTLYKGQGMPIVTEAQTIENFSFIKEDLKKIGVAYHLCELVDGLCAENQENKVVFSLLKNTFQLLSTDADIRTIIREFEIRILTYLGFYQKYNPAVYLDTSSFIERLLERRLKVRQLLPRFM